LPATLTAYALIGGLGTINKRGLSSVTEIAVRTAESLAFFSYDYMVPLTESFSAEKEVPVRGKSVSLSKNSDADASTVAYKLGC